jgi:hypothetical protein
VLVCLVVFIVACRDRPVGPPQGTARGHVATVPAEAGAVPGLPSYPGATLVSFEASADRPRGFRSVYRATFTCCASFEQVEGFFEGVILDGGWRLIRTSLVQRPQDGARSQLRLTLSKGSSSAVVDIGREADTVAFVIERRDR